MTNDPRGPLKANSVLADQMNRCIGMPGCRKEFLDHVCCAQFQTARAHTRMASDEFPFEDVFID